MNGRFFHVALRVVAALCCVTCVPAVTLILVHWLFGVPITAFRPLLNDEVTYWHQVATFSRVGFHGGYYTLGEVTNASGFTPFGPHGPGFIVLYGLFGAAFGWYRHSVVVLNLVAIGVAAWTWASLARLTVARLLLSALLLATFWQVTFWAPTGMQESMHHAGAIVMAALFASALGATGRPWTTSAGWVVLAVLSYIRPSWIVLMPLWALVTSRTASWTRLGATVAASLAVAALVVLAYTRSVAPFSTGFFFLKIFDPAIGVQPIVDNLSINIRRTGMFSDYEPLEVLHRVQYWSFMLAAGVLAVFAARRTWPSWRDKRTLPMIVAAVALGAALAMLLLLSELTNWTEHRVLSAFLLFAALVCIAAPGRAPAWLAAALIASNVVSTTVFLRDFDVNRRHQFVWDRRGVYALGDALAGRIVYQPDKPRWCNTLLTAQYPPYLIAVPAGIGISVVREPDQLVLPPRSHYMLLDAPALADFAKPPRVQALTTLPYGTLYVNLDSTCE